jgi:hypothetical protein
VKNDKLLNNYSKFSLQNPVSRHYLDEWFVHQILINQNVLTTRYEFVDLQINDQIKGLYAVEEHFTDNLLIAQNRKPGVILKYDEDEFWLSRMENGGKETRGVPWSAAAKIKTFSTKSIFADEHKKKAFFRGRDLLYQFHFKAKPVDEIIDLDKMAAFLALVDVTDAYHGLIWHNLRFYYNADTDLLEPIAYDLFSEEIEPKKAYDFLGQYFLNHPGGSAVNKYYLLFTNPDFIEKYLVYLKKFTQPDFFQNEKHRIEKMFLLYESELKKEYAFYSFDMERYNIRAKKIRDELDSFELKINKKLSNKPEVTYLKFSKSIDYLPVKNVSVKANIVDVYKTFILQLRGYYNKPLLIKGVVSNSDTVWLQKPLELPPYLVAMAPEIMGIELSAKPDRILYQTLENDSIYIQKVIEYRAPLK